MAKFVYLYTGGGMAPTPEEQEKAMQAWTAWFGELGETVADIGNPFGASSSVGSDGAVTSGAAPRIGGYTVVTADSLDDAAAKAKGCPILGEGGTVEVYEALEM